VFRVKGMSSRLPWLATDASRRHLPPIPDPETVRAIRPLLRGPEPTVVHAYGWITYSCLAALRGTHVPFVLSVRDYANICAVRTFVHHSDSGKRPCTGPETAKCISCARRFYGAPKGLVAAAGVLGSRRWLRRRVDAVQSNSSYMREIVEAHLGPFQDEVRSVVIPSFRDDAADDPPTSQFLGQLPSEPFILFVGALRLGKGLNELVDAYHRLAVEGRPPLVLIGPSAPDTPARLADVATVIEAAEHGDVMEAYARSLFCVFPSAWPEPLGNVVHEAMSRGKAVIGTYPGGMAEMITTGYDGLLVPGGDVGKLEEAMALLIEHPLVRTRLADAAAASAERFSAEAVLPQFARLYSELAGKSRGRT
jgi:glycosyltransferase involved in cell wall biosynthesis